MFGLLGYDALQNLFPKYGLTFVNTNLNFNSLTNSWMTLFAVGTGNYYSEIISRLISDPNAKNSLGLILFIELYFLIFYLCFYLVLKSFTIQIIIRYESYFGATLGIASQQVTVSLIYLSQYTLYNTPYNDLDDRFDALTVIILLTHSHP